MWNFLISGLSIGCTLVLYDGSPLKDPSILWRMTDELKITVFGTSAKYLDHLSVSEICSSFSGKSAFSWPLPTWWCKGFG